MTEREQFCAALWTGALIRGDAIVALCGEDAGPRLATAVQLLLTGGAPVILLSGGKDDPPRIEGAVRCQAKLFGQGIAPDKLLVESASQNTREQAVNVLEIARLRGWKRLLLVASPYHLPRAMLTFVQALRDVGQADAVQVVPVPAGQAPWWARPEGMTHSRLELLTLEFEKVVRYGDDIARYADGLAYLQRWEPA